MNKPDKVKIILKLLQDSNTLLIKSSQMQNEANIAVIDLIQDFDNSINKKIDLITSPDNNTMFNVRELSLLLKVTKATIYNWISEDKIIFHKLGNKTYFKKFELNDIILRYTK